MKKRNWYSEPFKGPSEPVILPKNGPVLIFAQGIHQMMTAAQRGHFLLRQLPFGLFHKHLHLEHEIRKLTYSSSTILFIDSKGLYRVVKDVQHRFDLGPMTHEKAMDTFSSQEKVIIEFDRKTFKNYEFYARYARKRGFAC